MCLCKYSSGMIKLKYEHLLNKWTFSTLHRSFLSILKIQPNKACTNAVLARPLLFAFTMYEFQGKCSFTPKTRELSGSVVKCLTPDQWLPVRTSPVSLRCVIEQETLILAYYWLTPGRPVVVYLQNC